MTTATAIWRGLLADVLERGRPVEQDSAGAEWRGRTSYELLGHQSVWPMSRAVVLCPERKLGYKFLAAEAAFILSGSNRLAEIVPYAPKLRGMSDDGVFLAGAYGPKFVDDLPYVLAALTRDPMTRQAVSTIWRPRPMSSADIPCTISLQWLIRNHDDVNSRLHCVATMRSSDLIFGLPYDVHVFAMASAYLALHLRPKLGPLDLGSLYLTAGSQHVYRLDREQAERCAAAEGELVDLRPLDLADFSKPEELIDTLWSFARREGISYGGWLEELR